MKTPEQQQFSDLAIGIELLLAALDYVEAAKQVLGGSKVLDTAAWCLRYVLYGLAETEEPRN